MLCKKLKKIYAKSIKKIYAERIQKPGWILSYKEKHSYLRVNTDLALHIIVTLQEKVPMNPVIDEANL